MATWNDWTSRLPSSKPRVQAIAETDVLAAQLSGEAPDTTPLSADIDRVQGEADRLLAQLGDREQMLGRFSTQAQGWEGPSLGLQQRADLAARLSMASPDLVPLSENMREGYRQIMERGLAVDAELTARLGRSQALKARLVALEAGLQDARTAADEALGLAARIEAGATVSAEAVPEAAAAHPVIAAVLERDQTIAALRTERGQLAQQLLDTRNELNAARQEIVDVTRQREAAMAGVENVRLLLNRPGTAEGEPDRSHSAEPDPGPRHARCRRPDGGSRTAPAAGGRVGGAGQPARRSGTAAAGGDGLDRRARFHAGAVAAGPSAHRPAVL